MEFHEIANFVNYTIRVRFFKEMRFYVRVRNKKEERYIDIIKKIPNVLNGIGKACTDQTLIIGLMDDEEDREVPIKIKDIHSVKLAKTESEKQHKKFKQ